MPPLAQTLMPPLAQTLMPPADGDVLELDEL